MNDSGDVGASLLPKAIRGSKLTSQPSANPEPGQWGFRPANDDHKSGEEIAANARPDNANENAKADRFNAINFAKISNDGRTDVASAGNMANSSANKKRLCIEACTRLALPTGDFGIKFQRCLNQCMGDNTYPEWKDAF